MFEVVDAKAYRLRRQEEKRLAQRNPRSEDSIREGAQRDLEPASMQRLVLAAVEAFAERGFHGTTTRDIAARANLSPAALYVHYRSKREVLYLIMRETHEEILRRMNEAIQENQSPAERLKALVRAHVKFHAELHTDALVANHELPALRPQHRAEIQKIRRRIEQLIDETLELCRESASFEVSDVRATTFLILSIGIGVSRWFSPTGRLSPSELGDLYAELVERMLVTRSCQQMLYAGEPLLLDG